MGAPEALVAARPGPPPRLSQIAMCTPDLPGSLELFTDVLGLADAGGTPVWGERLAAVQELQVAHASCLVWWVVGCGELVQVELFQHSVPRGRPLAVDWTAADVGWVRWGVVVSDFDRCLQGLHAMGIETMSDPVTFDGSRRVAFRDPFVGTIVEVLEPGPSVRRPVARFDVPSSILYATVAVTDLEAERLFYGLEIGLEEVEPRLLHPAGSDALWGLDETASRAVFSSGDSYLEIVTYPQTAFSTGQGRLLSDLGLMNVGLGFSTRAALEELVSHLAPRHPLSAPLQPSPDGPASGYLRTPNSASLELMAVPDGSRGEVGFEPRRTRRYSTPRVVSGR
jgi:catechol 2,3-dioxygenase-like lactoylglutathione lyase family enzyme